MILEGSGTSSTTTSTAVVRGKYAVAEEGPTTGAGDAIPRVLAG